jgi:hypothetical protein
MLIDCESCAMRDIACSDCVVTMLLDGLPVGGRQIGGLQGRAGRLGPAPTVEFDDDERRAVDVLAEAGLISPLRLVPLVQRNPVNTREKRSIA